MQQDDKLTYQDIARAVQADQQPKDAHAAGDAEALATLAAVAAAVPHHRSPALSRRVLWGGAGKHGASKPGTKHQHGAGFVTRVLSVIAHGLPGISKKVWQYKHGPNYGKKCLSQHDRVVMQRGLRAAGKRAKLAHLK